jgi:hypothetical protein
MNIALDAVPMMKHKVENAFAVPFGEHATRNNEYIEHIATSVKLLSCATMYGYNAKHIIPRKMEHGLVPTLACTMVMIVIHGDMIIRNVLTMCLARACIPLRIAVLSTTTNKMIIRWNTTSEGTCLDGLSSLTDWTVTFVVVVGWPAFCRAVTVMHGGADKSACTDANAF